MHLVPFPLAVTALLLTGCGGGGGGGAPATPVTVRIPSSALLDGIVSKGGGVALDGDISPGDFATGLRGFVSFELGDVPPAAAVTSATLVLTQHAVAGAPYAKLGLLLLDQVVYGNQLEAGAYARSFPMHQGLGPLSADATLERKSTLVTAQVQADRAAQRTQSQFRIRFAIEDDGDGVVDVAVFWSADNAPTYSDQPTLVVTYQP